MCVSLCCQETETRAGRPCSADRQKERSTNAWMICAHLLSEVTSAEKRRNHFKLPFATAAKRGPDLVNTECQSIHRVFFYNLDHVARSCTWLIFFWGHPLHPPFIFFCHLPHPVLSSSSSSSSSSSLPTQPIVQQPLKPYGEIYSWLQSKPEMVSDGEFHCTKPIWSHSAVAYGTALYATLLHYRPEGGWSHMFGFHARPCAFRLLPGRLGNILFMNSGHKRKKAECRDAFACLLSSAAHSWSGFQSHSVWESTA